MGATRRSSTSTALVDGQQGQYVFLGVDPALARHSRSALISKPCYAGWGAPAAHGFSTA